MIGIANGLRACLLAVGLLAVGGCNEDPAPVVAAKRFASAVQSRDTQAVLEMVDAKSLAYVDALAESASDQIGGRRSVAATEMLQIVDVNRRFSMARAELVAEEADAASVRVVGADGTEHILQMVREDGEWKVVIPTPTDERPPTAS